MKKSLLAVLMGLYFIGCGGNQITLDQVTKKGLTQIHNGMTKAEVLKILKKEPDTIQKVGNYELWIYEGVVVNDDTDERRYKNFSIKFNNGKVDYTGYFGCKLPKVED